MAPFFQQWENEPMRASLIILGVFCVGLASGYLEWLPESWTRTDFSLYALYLLMFLVGISIGADARVLLALRSHGLKLALVPLVTIFGTFTGILAVSMLSGNIPVTEGLAVGAGFGYYSLSSVIISELYSETLGVVALLSNIMREVMTLLFAPLMVAAFGKLAPIASAGATSMDTTLPIITASAGKEFAIVALFHGIVLTILVPVLVTLIISLA
jgi:uncharacterized membrane protein YbjE (DUF340 family)